MKGAQGGRVYMKQRGQLEMLLIDIPAFRGGNHTNKQKLGNK